MQATHRVTDSQTEKLRAEDPPTVSTAPVDTAITARLKELSLVRPPPGFSVATCNIFQKIEKAKNVAELRVLWVQHSISRYTTTQIVAFIDAVSRLENADLLALSMMRAAAKRAENFPVDERYHLIYKCVQFAHASQQMKNRAKELFSLLVSTTQILPLSGRELSILAFGYQYFKNPAPDAFTFIQNQLETHEKIATCSVDDLLLITYTFAKFGIANGFVSRMQQRLLEHPDLHLASLVVACRLIWSLSTHTELNELFLTTILQQRFAEIVQKIPHELFTLSRSLVRLSIPPPELIEGLFAAYLANDCKMLIFTTPAELSSLAEATSFQEGAQEQFLPLIKHELMRDEMTKLKCATHYELAILILAYSKAPNPDIAFLDILDEIFLTTSTLQADIEQVADLSLITDITSTELIVLARRLITRKEPALLPAIYKELFRRQRAWEEETVVSFLTSPLHSPVQLRQFELQMLLKSPLSLPASRKLFDLFSTLKTQMPDAVRLFESKLMSRIDAMRKHDPKRK